MRERMRTQGVSFKRALNDCIRDGAAGRPAVPATRTRTFAMGPPAVPLDRALQLAAALEDDELIARMRKGG